MTNLNSVNFGMNQFCGPSVLSILTGKSTDLCAAVISSISGKKEVKAAEYVHILEAFSRLGFNTVAIPIISRTLFGVLSNLVNKDGMYIVGVPKHVVAIEIKDKQIYFCDNHTKEPINAAASARLTQTVDRIYKIEAKPQPLAEDIVRERKEILNETINRINIQIGRLINERTRSEKELEDLSGTDSRRY